MSQEHTIAGYGFLFVVACAIGFGAKAGIQHSRRVALVQRIQEAEKYAAGGDTRKAVATLREVLYDSPNNVTVLFNLALAHLELNEDDEADAALQRVLAIDPQDYEATAVHALILKREGKVEEALSTLEKVPVGKGRVRDLLQTDPSWEDLDGNLRMNELRKKHGLPPLEAHGSDTSLLKDDEQAGYGGSPIRLNKTPPDQKPQAPKQQPDR
jgi:tetratricopeptide (TPR) repeat protein